MSEETAELGGIQLSRLNELKRNAETVILLVDAVYKAYIDGMASASNIELNKEE
jgi:hypothetical protein